MFSQVIDFVYELPSTDKNFCRHILKLVEKHFGENKLLFCLYGSTDTSARGFESGNAYNMVSKGINLQHIKTFHEKFREDDIFSVRNIPASLRQKTVLRSSDLIDSGIYSDSIYGQCLLNSDLYHQLCMFILIDERRVGSVSVFRTYDEGDFTEEDVKLYTVVAKLISKSYENCIKTSDLKTIHTAFDRYFSGHEIGAAILDREMAVTTANQSFEAYSEYIFVQANLDSGIFSPNVICAEDAYLYSQKLVDFFGNRVIAAPRGIVIDCLLYNFQIYSQALFFTTEAGTSDVQHLVNLIRRPKITSSEVKKMIESLTSRELEVLVYVEQGMDTRELARALSISVYTVKAHLQNIYRKFSVSGRVELLAKLRD